MKPYIITIARQYGSGGKTVGKMLAERLASRFTTVRSSPWPPRTAA